MKEFGEYLKALREAKGLSLREVERKTEVSNAYLSQMESGKIKQPSPITLNKLAELYGISYNILMEKVGYPITQHSNRQVTHNPPLAARIGDISDEEELELLQYLKLIRNRRR
ncbi:helix-turn-helix domain-containing protein [Runella slithyformis]|nr:helix-turn-helix transcriptional regulator [Runella slithyformis]